MPIRISGPGLGLPAPQTLYPANLAPNAPYTPGQNAISLAPGEVVIVPPGDFWIDPGKYSQIQVLDPVTTTWRGWNNAREQLTRVFSDGFNVRVFNPLGCNVAAVVTTVGSAYVQSTTSITPSSGNSTWQPIVGGQPGSVTITSVGANYGIAPQIYIPAPPSPGIPMTAYATITSGTLNSISITNAGGGYAVVPPITILPSPYDPNLSSITAGVAKWQSLLNSGAIVGVLCTNPGVPTASAVTFTVTPSGASVTAVWMSTTTSLSLSSAGGALGTSGYVTSTGGNYQGTAEASGAVQPYFDLSGYVPRPLITGAATLSGGSITTIGTILDGGQFVGTASPVVVSALTGAPTLATIVLTQGSVPDTVWIQPA